MSVKQISIFLENRPGRLVTVAKVLGDANCSILALSVADTKDFGIVRMIVEEPEKAQKVLKDHDILGRINEVTAVGIDSAPGSLATVLSLFTTIGVNVEYMYALAEPRSKHAIMVFRFDEAEKAEKALQQAGIRIFNDDDLIHNDLFK